MDPDMQTLARQAQGGDRAAFAELYEQLAPKIYAHFYHRVNGNPQLAEDLTEDVFVKVLAKLDRYQDRGLPFAAWVYRIAQNHLIDYYRKASSRGTVPIDERIGLIDRGAEQSLDRGLTREWLVAALQRLTEDQRRVIVLRFLQGMSTLETALAVDKTEDAVKKLQARGLLALRRVLGDEALADLAA